MNFDNEPGCWELTPERATHHAKRAGKKNAARFAQVVEGKLYSIPQIAKRIGWSRDTARRRVANAPKPLTWENLMNPIYSTKAHDS